MENPVEKHGVSRSRFALARMARVIRTAARRSEAEGRAERLRGSSGTPVLRHPLRVISGALVYRYDFRHFCHFFMSFI